VAKTKTGATALKRTADKTTASGTSPKPARLKPAGAKVLKPSAAPARPKTKAPKRPRGTGANFVYESLKAKILNLDLKPGTLLDETELSRQFHLSRSPVREALIRLSAEGLVETPRNRTSMVSHFDFSTLPAYFDAMQLLYRLSARLAAINPSPAQVAELRVIEDRLEAAHTAVDVLGIVRLNREFHSAIAAMSGNPFIAGWMRSLLDQGQRVLRFYIRHYGDRVPSPKMDMHRALIAAIERGDPAAAEVAGRRDAENLIDEVLRILAERPTSKLSLDAAGGR
jgi:DNA-binding GntR family transcriptional regulator